jgi:hypothetical protein
MLDHRGRCSPDHGDETGVGPGGKDAALQPGELPAQDAGTPSLEVLHETMNTELRVNRTGRVNVVRHDQA